MSLLTNLILMYLLVLKECILTDTTGKKPYGLLRKLVRQCAEVRRRFEGLLTNYSLRSIIPTAFRAIL